MRVDQEVCLKYSKKLVSSHTTEQQGFHTLNAVIENVDRYVSLANQAAIPTILPYYSISIESTIIKVSKMLTS